MFLISIPNTGNRNQKTKWIAWLLALAALAVSSICPLPAFSQEILESQGLRYRLIPGGSYLLGSPANEAGRYDDEAPPHVVELAAFYMAVNDTTNAQYRQFLKATGHQAPLYWQDKNLNGPTQPVVGVTWEDAVAFCRWLTQVTGVEHRLPTEAQWEAAARGGLAGQPYPWGAEAPDAGGVRRANFRQAATGQDGYRFTAPVGSFPANGFGLFDMAGNVSQWCQDRYEPLAASGPFRPGVQRLLKGGSWLSQARDLRAAARQASPPRYADGYIGFRVVRLQGRL